MSAGPPDPLQSYRDELLRWNRRFNLLSRRDPERTLTRLLAESRAALGILARALRELAPGAQIPALDVAGGAGAMPGSLLLVDIGAGNGILGVSWHVELRRLPAPAGRPFTCLVEPRGKRAWFLERAARRVAPGEIEVLPRRWGAGEGGALGGLARRPGPRLWLLALRALDLGEAELLAGWRHLAGAPALGEPLVVCRFRPGASADPAAEAARLGLPPPAHSPGEAGTAAGSPFSLLLPGAPAAAALSLLVSLYPPGSLAQG